MKYDTIFQTISLQFFAQLA